MKLLVIIATPDPDVERVILQRKEALIPSPTREQIARCFRGARLNISCFISQHQSRVENFISHLTDRLSPETQGVVVLVDQNFLHLVKALRDICFVVQYSANQRLRSPSNFFGSLLAGALANYINFARQFDDAKSRKLLALPLQNFDAQELRDLRTVCADPGTEKRFAENLEQQLKRLRQRQKPKRYSDYKDVFLVDDHGKHFVLGHEKHAQADTKQPPHNQICLLGIDFRFGRRLDSSAHYNVSMGGKDERMTGMYFDCHGDLRPGEGKTHLNMFSNDFF